MKTAGGNGLGLYLTYKGLKLIAESMAITAIEVCILPIRD